MPKRILEGVVISDKGDKTVVVVETKGMPEDLSKDLAMHVAALAPQFTSRDGVSAKALAVEGSVLDSKATK